MALGKLPTAGPNDEFTTWNWLKRSLSAWIQGLYYPNVSSTASFTVGLNFFYPVNATSGNLVVTLPIAAKQLGKIYVIKKTDSSANTVTVTADTTKPDLIDGQTTRVLSTQYDTVYLLSDGISNWWTLASDVIIQNAQMAPMAGATIKGNPTGGTAVPQDMTGAVTTALLSNFVASGASHAKGLVPDPGASSGTAKFLREDATWVVPPSMSQFITVLTTGVGTTAAAPAGTTACEIILQAAGGGTISTAGGASAIGGAGSGEWVHRIIPVTAGLTYGYSVGAKSAGVTGGNTVFIGDGAVNWVALGGVVGNTGSGGAGGGRLGPAGGAKASPGGAGLTAVNEGLETISGASGGGQGTNSANQAGGAGGPCEQNAGGTGGAGAATPAPGGAGGAASRYGIGGNGGNAAGAGTSPAATAYGAGAGGHGGLSTAAALAGADGLLMYRWI